MARKDQTVGLHVRIPGTVARALSRQAGKEGVTLSVIVRRILNSAALTYTFKGNDSHGKAAHQA